MKKVITVMATAPVYINCFMIHHVRILKILTKSHKSTKAHNKAGYDLKPGLENLGF